MLKIHCVCWSSVKLPKTFWCEFSQFLSNFVFQRWLSDIQCPWKMEMHWYYFILILHLCLLILLQSLACLSYVESRRALLAPDSILYITLAGIFHIRRKACEENERSPMNKEHAQQAQIILIDPWMWKIIENVRGKTSGMGFRTEVFCALT